MVSFKFLKIEEFEILKSITYVLLGKGVNKLWKNLVRHNSLGELVRVVGESSKSKGGRLLDGRDVIEEERSEEGHHT